MDNAPPSSASGAWSGRRAAALAASLFLGPGSGHVALGRLTRGLVYYLVVGAAALSVVFSGLVYPLLLAAVIYLVAALECLLLKPRGPAPAPWSKLAVVWLVFLLVGVGANLATRQLGRAYKIPAGSSFPTLLVGDQVLVRSLGYAAERGDTVVFHYPPNPQKDFVKRIVAVGGDTVKVVDNIIHLNGKPVPARRLEGDCFYEESDGVTTEKKSCVAYEETLDGKTYRVIHSKPSYPMTSDTIKVPAGHVYVLGDNRDNSHDSRYWGTVAKDLLVGKVTFVWFSSGEDGIRFERLGKTVQ